MMRHSCNTSYNASLALAFLRYCSGISFHTMGARKKRFETPKRLEIRDTRIQFNCQFSTLAEYITNFDDICLDKLLITYQFHYHVYKNQMQKRKIVTNMNS
ncbi:hypothetical protein VNO77_25502 [Canavalia gladiata]|uniref:Uncharacterized protein n=1 Tax=Canavalia gladiata TaxID=3824 RepID=A0AAN9LAR1_CANGL